MKKFKSVLSVIFCIFIVIGICGCSNSEENIKHEICVALKLSDIPDFNLEKHLSGNGKDTEEYYVISFEEAQAEEFKNETASVWKNAPVSSEFKNFTDYASIIPESTITRATEELTALNAGGIKYYFLDRTYEFKTKYEDKLKGENMAVHSFEESIPDDIGGNGWYSSEDPRSSKYAVGFSCGFFDESNGKLYVYTCEKSYSRDLLQYLD